MYCAFLTILVTLSTQQVTFGATTPVTTSTSNLLETKDEFELNKATSAKPITDDSIGSNGVMSFVPESTSFSSGSDESLDHLFQFVHDADVTTEKYFSHLVQNLENTIEEQYKEGLGELEQWSSIPMLSEYQDEAIQGLKKAKDELSRVTEKQKANILNQLQDVKNTKSAEELQKCMQQQRKLFEIEIMSKLQYFIDALSAIKSIGQERMKNEYSQGMTNKNSQGTRSLQLTRSTPQMGESTIENDYSSVSSNGQEKISKSVVYGSELGSRMRRNEPMMATTNSVQNGLPTRIGTPMQTSNQLTESRTGGMSSPVRSTSSLGGEMISQGSGMMNDALSFGSEISRTGLSSGQGMMDKTLAYGEEMTDSFYKKRGNMGQNVKSGTNKMRNTFDDAYKANERMSDYISDSGRGRENMSSDSSSNEEDSFEHHQRHRGRPPKHHGPPHKHHGPRGPRGPHRPHGPHRHCKNDEEEFGNRKTYQKSELDEEMPKEYSRPAVK